MCKNKSTSRAECNKAVKMYTLDCVFVHYTSFHQYIYNVFRTAHRKCYLIVQVQGVNLSITMLEVHYLVLGNVNNRLYIFLWVCDILYCKSASALHSYSYLFSSDITQIKGAGDSADSLLVVYGKAVLGVMRRKEFENVIIREVERKVKVPLSHACYQACKGNPVFDKVAATR